MNQIILAQGLFPLTQEAADAALDAIDFIAAAVRGYDAIDVTNIVRPIWRQHLAYWYPQLDPGSQLWYANAPQTLASIHAQWPQLNSWQRNAILQQWAIALPQMLWMIDPVLAQAQAMEMEQTHRSQLDSWRQDAISGQPAYSESEQAVYESNKSLQSAVNLQNYSATMTTNTLNLMSAISGSNSRWETR